LLDLVGKTEFEGKAKRATWWHMNGWDGMPKNDWKAPGANSNLII